MPLARHDFLNMPWASVDGNIRLALFRQTLQGLQHAHSHGIMHRDVAPKNLLVISTDPPRAGLCDWGKSTRSTRDIVTTLGPFDAVAPEVWTANESNPYDKSIDIWSLGYTWLNTIQRPADLHERPRTGRFRNSALLRSIEALRTTDPPRISADLAQLLSRMLAFDPRQRPTAGEALSHRVWAGLQNLEHQSFDLGVHSPPQETGPAKRPRMVSPDSDSGRGDAHPDTSDMAPFPLTTKHPLPPVVAADSDATSRPSTPDTEPFPSPLR